MKPKTEGKHTPGPWTVDEIDGGYLIGADKLNGSHIAEAMSLPDARLIAAAPDLYGTAKEVADDLLSLPPEDATLPIRSAINRLLRSIKKAEGREP